MKRLIYIFILFVSLAGNVFAQEPSPFKLWELTSFSGQFRGRGTYRLLQTGTPDNLTSQGDAFLDGILQFRTRSFIIHPNFCQLSLNAIFDPSSHTNTYIGLPNTSEKTTNQGIDASALFFKKKNFNLVLNGNYNNSISNVENVSLTRSNTSNLGAVFNTINKILPFNVSYTLQNLDQVTIGSNREVLLKQELFQFGATKSFSAFDNTAISFNNNHTQSSQSDPSFLVPLNLNYTVQSATLNNTLNFDKEKKYLLASSLANTYEYGDVKYNQLYGMENLIIKLPWNFAWSNYYTWSVIAQDSTKMLNNGIQSMLSHQLYESLNSRLSFDHRTVDQNNYIEQRDRVGVDFKYTKKIPGGKLNIMYNYARENQQVNTPASQLHILREEVTLADNEITFLKKPNPIASTIVVKDVTGGITYQPNLDYYIIDKSPYVEIVRIPGGLIPNNTNVYVNYYAEQAGLYKYIGNNNGFAIDVTYWKGRLNTYYRVYNQDYNNLTPTSNVVLNYVTRQNVGLRLTLDYLKSGIEYEDYRSTLVPYTSMRYYINLQKMYKRVFVSLNGNLQEYQMFQENLRRTDTDLSTKVGYKLLGNVKVDFEYMLKNMRGQSMNLASNIFKIDVTATFQKLFLSLGADLYDSRSSGYVTEYKGTYIMVTRNF